METDITNVLHGLGLDKWIPIALAFHTLASTIDASLPQPAPGSHWLPFRKLVSILALNFGHAKDTGQPRIVTWLQRVVIMLAAVVPPPPELGSRNVRIYPKEPDPIVPPPHVDPVNAPAFIPPSVGTPQ